MKITTKELTTEFIPALREISTLRTNTKVAYNTVKTIKKASTFADEFTEARKNIFETRAMKDASGKPKIEDNEYIFITPQDKEEAIASVEELGKMEVELDIFPISLSDLNGAFAPNYIYDKDKKFVVGTEWTPACVSAQTLLGLKDFVKDEMEVEKK